MLKFAGMKQPKFIITGKSRLIGSREAISRPMELEMAKSCLERMKKKHAAYTRCRVERIQPTQLMLNFIND